MTQFDIFPIAVGAGYVGLSPMPGYGGDYDGDIDTIAQWRPDVVISATTTPEMQHLGISSFGQDMRARSIKWVHLPVSDFGVPTSEIEPAWQAASARVTETLAQGGRVLVHCRGGCGRSGMIVMRLMVEHKEPPDLALIRLRKIRTCAVETNDQRLWASLGYPR